MRRILLSILKISVSAALLYAALGKVDFSALLGRFSPASIGWILAAILVAFMQLLLAGIRWHLLSPSCGAPLSFVTACRFVLIGMFFNQTLPSSIGGDAVRIWLVGRRVGWRTAAYSVFIDRTIGLVGLAVLILICLPWSLAEINDVRARFGLLAVEATAIGGAVAFVAISALPTRWIERWQTTQHLGQCSTIARNILFHSRQSPPIWLLSISIHALNASIMWCAAAGIDAKVSFFQLLLLVPPVALVTLLPISIAGWGLRETALGAAFASAGLSATDGIALSLLFGAINFFIGGIGGLTWILSAEKAEQGSKPIEVPADEM